ncbi:hypothetical protein BJ165DRAFT_1520570 [Panaeolus papilionaceus]|nr:hypothetical protein BJ165DRAFT_1520570 [Panaeolus papilionaceus]
MPVCPQCDNRSFTNKEALLQHIRSSSAWHPFCGICDRRFTSTTAFNAHMTAKHPPTWDCALCERSYHAEFALEDHYRGSNAHPNCSACGQGFFDIAARDEHHRVAHVPAPVSTVETDGLQLSPESAKSICDLLDSDSADPPLVPTTPPQDHKLDPVVSTGFTPLSPHNHAQRLILGHSARDTDIYHSPDLRLDTIRYSAYASPLLETKPIFSPTTTHLPRPGSGFEQIWRSKENISSRPSSSALITSTPPLRPPLTSSFSRHSSFQNGSVLPSSPPLPRLSEPNPIRSSSIGTSTFSSRFSTMPRMGRESSGMNSARDSFDKRLYPGSFRHRARLALTDDISTSAPPSQAEFETGLSSQSSFSDNGSFGHGPGRPRAASTDSEVGWASLMDPKNADQQPVPLAHSPPPAARISEYNSGTSTPRLSGSISDANDDYASSLLDLDITPTTTSVPIRAAGSPTAASVSSPGSAKSYFFTSSPKTHEADTRPTTANSSHSATPFKYGNGPIKYIVTASSERGGSPLGSPTVDSPEDLSLLPNISPLITTPIDVSFEIPEAKRPLPESPAEPSSPVTVIVDLEPVAETKLSPPTLQPLEPPQVTISPISDTLSPHPLKIEPTSIASPKSPVPRSANPNPLHCRACLADSCDDITASMCGHIFCNRCITDAVIKTSRCPVCMTPTLLYCLFRLDLGA